MKLHKALKVKNRLVGEINNLQKVLQRENSRRNDNLSKVNCSETYDKLLDSLNRLVTLKTAIAKANTVIYDKIYEMDQLKSLMVFLKTLLTKEGEELVYMGPNENKLYTWSCFMNQQAVDKALEELQVKVNNRQDEIDCANSVTELDYDIL